MPRECIGLIGLGRMGRRLGARIVAAGYEVRSPVLGTLPSAEAGELTALVSGSPGAVERAQPILQHLSSRQHYVGSDEQARVAKLIVNGLLARALASFCEGISVGEKAGLDRETPQPCCCCCWRR